MVMAKRHGGDSLGGRAVAIGGARKKSRQAAYSFFGAS